MDFHELSKMRVTDLRELAKEKTPLTGVSGLNKAQLIDQLADALGIEKPHLVAMGSDKPALKRKIRELKKVRLDALAAKDRDKLHNVQKELKKVRRRLRHEAKDALRHSS